MHNRTLNALHPSGLFSQQENEVIVYSVNWAGVLNTDTISVSTWTAENSSPTIASESNTTTLASAKLSGSPGTYMITNKITTAAGETREKQLTLKIKDNNSDYISDYS